MINIKPLIEFHNSLETVEAKTLIGLSVKEFRENPTVSRFFTLIQELKQMHEDNPNGLQKALGNFCYNRLRLLL